MAIHYYKDKHHIFVDSLLELDQQVSPPNVSTILTISVNVQVVSHTKNIMQHVNSHKIK